MSLSFTLERADDGVSLTVTVDGMTVRETPQGAVLDRAATATITVEYPAQHIVEYADTVAGQAPIQEAAIFAPASRVVFAVPAGTAPIPLTVAGLLGALPTLPLNGGSGSVPLQQVVDPAAAVRSAASTAQRRQRAAAARAAADVGAVASRDPHAAPPTEADGTSVYVPSRLELAIPSGAARFVHAPAPVQRGDLVESWHSRFAVSSPGGPPVEITTSAVVRSIAVYRTPPATTPANISYAKIVDEKKIASALDDAADDLRTQTGTTPLTMRQLTLSPAGGTVDLEGTWSHADGTWPANDREPPLAAYKHRVVLGRDVEIRKVLRGRLFPLGHPAILTETTRRVARTIDQGSAAALFTQSIITVRQPTKTYPQGDRTGRAWPWTQITITNPVSPPGVDEIETVFGTPEEEFHILRVDGEPFVSECRASDIGGNEVAFSLAQIFVPDGQNLALAAVLWRAFADPSSQFADRFGGFDLHGNTVLTAPAPPAATSPNADATSLHVSRVTLDRFATSVADFRPTVAQFVATSPVIDALHGPTSAVFSYAEPYLANAFGSGNAAELLMTVEAAAADFGGQAAGLVKAQTAPIRALSRSIGAVAAQAVPGKDVGQVLTDLAGGHFEPSAWFKLPDSKLFGVFGLDEVLARAGVTAHQLANAPKQLVEIVEGTKKITVHWQTTLLAAGEEFPADDLPVTLGTADGKAMTLDLRSVTEVNLASQTARTTNRCTIENAALKIGPTPPAGQTHLVTLPIRSITFESTDTAAPDVDLQVGQVSFGGALAFVKTLADLLASSGLGKPERAARMADRTAGSKTLAPRAAPASGPSIEVIGDVIRARLAFALPDVAVGVFSLQDLAFASTFELSVTGATRPTLTLDFATVENPFRLTVSLIGGGGYLRVRVDTGGLVLVAGALEFGAAIAVNLAGVVAGYASVMGGVYFELAGNDISLTGYLAIKGKLSVLGIVSVAVEVNLALAYDPNSQKVEGRAELAIKIKVFVFKKTVRFEVHKQFAGANSDPSFAEIMAPADWPDPAELPWDTYCTAFAPV